MNIIKMPEEPKTLDTDKDTEDYIESLLNIIDRCDDILYLSIDIARFACGGMNGEPEKYLLYLHDIKGDKLK